MLALPLIPKACRHQTPHWHGRNPPTAYMEDYSVIGLRVDPLDDALRILETHHYTIVQAGHNVQVAFDSSARIPVMVELLRRHGVGCDVSDVIDEVYQG